MTDSSPASLGMYALRGVIAAMAMTGMRVVTVGFDLLLIVSGPVTALPLLWFSAAARRLNLSTVGFFQYIAPSTQFLLAIFVYGEPFTPAHAVTFPLIWTALAIFTADAVRRQRRAAAAARAGALAGALP